MKVRKYRTKEAMALIKSGKVDRMYNYRTGTQMRVVSRIPVRDSELWVVKFENTLIYRQQVKHNNKNREQRDKKIREYKKVMTEKRVREAIRKFARKIKEVDNPFH